MKGTKSNERSIKPMNKALNQYLISKRTLKQWKYNQEIPQIHSADQPMEPRVIQRTLIISHKTSGRQLKQSNQLLIIERTRNMQKEHYTNTKSVNTKPVKSTKPTLVKEQLTCERSTKSLTQW